MPQGLNGTSSSTPNSLLLDAGEIYINYVDVDNLGDSVGATRGGTSVAFNRDMRDIEFDGRRGRTKGMVRRENIDPEMSGELLEITRENLEMAIAGSITTDGVITGGEIKDGDYINVAYVGRISGKSDPVVIVLKNCLVSIGEISTADRDEATLPVTFMAHHDLSDLDADEVPNEPWEIIYPPVLLLNLASDTASTTVAADTTVSYTTDPATVDSVVVGSSDTGVATATVDEVAEEVTITGVAAGTATITVTATVDGTSVTEEITVTVS